VTRHGKSHKQVTQASRKSQVANRKSQVAQASDKAQIKRNANARFETFIQGTASSQPRFLRLFASTACSQTHCSYLRCSGKKNFRIACIKGTCNHNYSPILPAGTGPPWLAACPAACGTPPISWPSLPFSLRGSSPALTRLLPMPLPLPTWSRHSSPCAPCACWLFPSSAVLMPHPPTPPPPCCPGAPPREGLAPPRVLAADEEPGATGSGRTRFRARGWGASCCCCCCCSVPHCCPVPCRCVPWHCCCCCCCCGCCGGGCCCGCCCFSVPHSCSAPRCCATPVAPAPNPVAAPVLAVTSFAPATSTSRVQSGKR